MCLGTATYFLFDVSVGHPLACFAECKHRPCSETKAPDINVLIAHVKLAQARNAVDSSKASSLKVVASHKVMPRIACQVAPTPVARLTGKLVMFKCGENVCYCLDLFHHLHGTKDSLTRHKAQSASRTRRCMR